MKKTLSKEDIKSCLHIATIAAMRAGAKVISYYGKNPEVYRSKGSGYDKTDIVTQADHASQKIIEKFLVNYHPKIGFLGEEDDSNKSRFEKAYFWSVDPLDGTKPFINFLNGFSISIALVSQEGSPILGVCYFPVFYNLFYGVVGQNAYHNEKKIIMPKDEGSVKVYLSEAESLPPKKNHFYNTLRTNILGSAFFNNVKPEILMAPVQKGCLLAKGNIPSIFYGLPREKLGVSLWDLAAIAAIVLAGGGYVSDIYGKTLDLNRKDSTYIHNKGFLFATSNRLAKIVLETFKSQQESFK